MKIEIKILENIDTNEINKLSNLLRKLGFSDIQEIDSDEINFNQPNTVTIINYDFFLKDIVSRFSIESLPILIYQEREFDDGENFFSLPIELASLNQKIISLIFDNKIRHKSDSSMQLKHLDLKNAALETTTDGILILDAKLNIVDYSKRFKKLWNLPDESFMNHNFNQILRYCLRQIKDPQKFLNNLKNIIRESPDKSHTTVEFYNDNVFSVESTPFENKDIKNGRIWIFHDISEQVAMEKEKRNLQKQKQRAQKLETIGTLAGGIAHDFNNILTPIMGFAEIMKYKMDKSDPMYPKVEQIYTAAERAKDLIKQVLHFSRDAESEMRSIDVVLIIKEALKLIRATIPATIKVNYISSKTRPRILADATQIHQVIMNLCTNAYHAMESSGGILKVELKEVYIDEETSKTEIDLSEGNYFSISISDTGVGMSQEIMNHIFEPFFTTKKDGKGTGMGLSVVHGIIKNHNGKIKVYSELGIGTTFSILLPIIEKREEKAKKEKSIIEKGTESILVVDDREYVSKMLNTMLSGFGYKVSCCNDSLQALQMFSENPDDFDLVITDFTMPNMTGIDLAKQIHLIRNQTPVILVTGHSAAINEEDIKEAGINKILNKPIMLVQLSNIIREMLSAQTTYKGDNSD